MLSIIMPAYNEAENICRSIQESVKILEKTGLEYELILVDDGSEDDTYNKAVAVSQNYKNVKVFRYKENKGKGYALKYGFKYAKGNLIMFKDADLDLPSSQIPRFLDYMNTKQADVIIGSKRHPLSKVQFPLSRRILSRCYSVLVKMLFNLKVTDTQVGIKLFRKEVLDSVLSKVSVDGFAFDLELLVNINQYGFKIDEAPVDLDFQFHSTIHPKNILRMLQDTLSVYGRGHFGNNYANGKGK